MKTSDLSVTTMGERHLHHREPCEMQEITAQVLTDLIRDSHFFDAAPRSLPAFHPKEVLVGPELGTGEFGAVSEVSALCLDDSCNCETPLARGSVPLATVLPEACHIPPLGGESKLVPPPESIVVLKRSSSVTFANGTKPPSPTTTRKTVAGALIDKTDLTQFDTISIYDGRSCCDDDCSEDGGLGSSDHHNTRQRMAAHTHRCSGTARYAMKCLKVGIDSTIKVDAAIDLACEAMYLRSISHPNVIRIRGTVGTPGTPQFSIMLDRIVQTLHEKILDWRTINKKNRGRVGGLFGRDKAGQESLLVERFTAGLELARALRYLHFKRIIYRDLKPENIGFDSEGVLKLFDFGLAKELKPKDLVEKPDGYDCTGLTGSRRYMSPECLLCRLYGFSADVYSFGILLWQILALKTPFAVYDASQHFVIVVEKNHRPPRLPHLPSQINMMMEESWSRNPRKRPTFKQICQILQVSLTQRSGSSTSSDTDRSTHVTERSIRSLRESDNSIVASACECE